MGLRLIVGKDYTCMYCSTVMQAFGPVFCSEDEAEHFLEWNEKVARLEDPRLMSDSTLIDKVQEFRVWYENGGVLPSQQMHCIDCGDLIPGREEDCPYLRCQKCNEGWV